MPRVKTGIPREQLEIEEDLRSRYGGMMRITDVQTELGVKRYETARQWLQDVPMTRVNKSKRWRVAAVAEKIYRDTRVEAY